MCAKVTYPTKRAARKSLRWLQKHEGGDYLIQRVYRCPICGKWHRATERADWWPLGRTNER